MNLIAYLMIIISRVPKRTSSLPVHLKFSQQVEEEKRQREEEQKKKEKKLPQKLSSHLLKSASSPIRRNLPTPPPTTAARSKDSSEQTQTTGTGQSAKASPPPRRTEQEVEEEDEEEEDEDEEDEEEEEEEQQAAPELNEQVKSTLFRLQEVSQRNDYFKLFELTAQTNVEEINKKRRELTRKLHPDQFTNDKEAQEDAGKRLAKINEVYVNVFKEESSLEVYKKLCLYRKEYQNLLRHREEMLQAASNNLVKMKKVMKGANMPTELREEIDLVLLLLKQFKNIEPTE